MNRAVLVVDDDPRSRKLARDTLASLGYVVIEATTAEQAVELAGHVPPALILMDIRLPGMSGLEALVELRAKPALKGVPVVAVTASALRGEESKLLEKGFNGCVAKPYHFRELAELVDQLIGSQD